MSPNNNVSTVPANIEKKNRGRPRKYPYPARLTCSITGKVVKTNPTQFKKMLKSSGLEMDAFIKGYVCRSARKQIKNDQQKTKESVSETSETVATPIETPIVQPA